MSARNEKSRPAKAAHSKSLTDVPDPTSLIDRTMLRGVQARLRASRRLVRLADGRQDPIFDLPCVRACPGCGRVSGPETSDFGLTPAELRAEADRLTAEGWAAWEIRTRLTDPSLTHGGVS